MRQRLLAALACAAAIAGCSAPDIRPAVVTPLQTHGIHSEIQLLPPEVSSRETDAGARRRNQIAAAAVTSALEKSLAARGKPVGSNGRYTVISRVHVVYKGARVKVGEQTKTEAGSIEVQLVLQDRTRDEAAYSTLTKTAVAPTLWASWFGWGPDADDIMRETIEGAAADFASRL